MPKATTRSVLSGIKVKEAMRRQVTLLDKAATIASGIRVLIKFRADALVVKDARDVPVGIVSKTDLTGSFYAGLPIETPLTDIMVGPLITCFVDDKLEDALACMRDGGIHQIFVIGADPGRVEGMVNYGDILELVYKTCRRCRKRRRYNASNTDEHLMAEPRVAEVMTPTVITCHTRDKLYNVMESLTANRMSAVLVTTPQGDAAGVISKTNLIMAWHRGIEPDTEAIAVMSAPVIACAKNDSISRAMANMLLGDMGRIFVYGERPATIVGVLSLTDAANHRSGTCRACVASRIIG